MAVFRDLTPCCLAANERRFGGACYVHYQVDAMAMMMEVVRSSETSVTMDQITISWIIFFLGNNHSLQ